MARLIKREKDMKFGFILETVFEDSTSKERRFFVGDVINDLRYVENEEIIKVSGKIIEIKYTMPNKLSWNKNRPANTLESDVTLTSLVIDASDQYDSKIVTIPMEEILEFEDELSVARMKYKPHIIYDLVLYYSDYSVQNVSIEVGDVFGNVRIIDVSNIGTDIIGEFSVIGFAYTNRNGVINITGLALQNTETKVYIVTDFEYIISMINEQYKVNNEDIEKILAELMDGDSLILNNPVDKKILIDKNNIKLAINNQVDCDGSKESGIEITGNVIINGTGRINNVNPYDESHGDGAVRISGSAIINTININANAGSSSAGQFGILVLESGNVTVNNAMIESGWYCISGNGAKTTADSEIKINDGYFKSIYDYAIYHPHPGKLIINGGTFIGGAGALAVNNGNVEINGGEFTLIGNGDTGEFSDGTGGLSNALINLNARYGDITVRINGGTFNSGNIVINTGYSVDLQIRSGKFKTRPDDSWISQDSYIIQSSDGYFTVVLNG